MRRLGVCIRFVYEPPHIERPLSDIICCVDLNSLNDRHTGGVIALLLATAHTVRPPAHEGQRQLGAHRFIPRMWTFFPINCALLGAQPPKHCALSRSTELKSTFSLPSSHMAIVSIPTTHTSVNPFRASLSFLLQPCNDATSGYGADFPCSTCDSPGCYGRYGWSRCERERRHRITHRDTHANTNKQLLLDWTAAALRPLAALWISKPALL